MLLADGGIGDWWMAILVGIGTTAAAVGAAATRFLDSKSTRQLKEQADAVEAYKVICDRQEIHIARLEKQVEQQQTTIAKQQELNTEARETIQELYGYLRLMHSALRRQAETLKEKGWPVEPIPNLPDLKPHRGEEQEFMLRTAATNSVLSKEVAEQLVLAKKKPSSGIKLQ